MKTSVGVSSYRKERTVKKKYKFKGNEDAYCNIVAGVGLITSSLSLPLTSVWFYASTAWGLSAVVTSMLIGGAFSALSAGCMFILAAVEVKE